MLFVPARTKQNTQQQDDDVDEHHRHCLRDRQIKYRLAVLNNLTCVVAFCCNGQAIRTLTQPIGIGMVFELR